MKAFPVTLICYLSAGLLARAAEPALRFSLERAVYRTLAQSPAVRVQEAEIDRREGLREQVSGEFDLLVGLSASTNTERKPVFDALGRDTISAGEATAYTLSGTRKLRNGVVIQPSVEVGVSERSSPVSPSLGSSRASLQIIVPLLRGLGSEISGAAEAAARGDTEVARLLYRHSLASQALLTVQAYWSARAANAALQVRRDDEQRAQRLHEGIRTLVAARVFAPNILLQSEANLRQKSTTSQQADLAMLDAGFELSRRMGLPPEEMVKVATPDQPLPVEVSPSDSSTIEVLRLRWINHAYLKRADYLATRQSEVPLRILTRQAESNLQPRLDLSVRAGYAGLNRGTSLVAPLSQRATGTNGELGFVLEWPTANHYQQGLLRARRATQRQAELSSAQAQIDIAADVCSALEEVRLRAATMRNAAATAEIAQKAVEQEQRRLQTGEATVLDVINLENLLSSARLSKIDAQAGYAIAVARLRFAVGEIFLGDASERALRIADLTQLPVDEK